MLRLILPDTSYLASYVAALREGYYRGVQPIIAEEEIKKIESDPYPHLAELNRQGGRFTPPDGIERDRVPCNEYWMVDKTDFIGSVSIRWNLNDFLELHGGHIGYGIRPGMKRKGFAKKILALSLMKLRQIDIKTVIVTADDENIGSWKAIEANGGVLVDKHPSVFNEGSIGRRYTIDIAKLRQT